ncbi:MAG: ABC transporter substrate-binding protein [Clostridia bacterium]|nr:ABC transporter substrate-binding protein [Clostridia bacterium]
MKRLLAFCMALGMVLSAAGCKSKTAATSDEIPTLIWYLNCSNQAGADAVLEKINERLVNEIGAKLQIKFIDPGAYNEKMNMNMASGTEFDLCFSGYVNNYSNAVKQGGLMQIKDIIDKEAPELWNLIPDYAWKSITVNDDVYAVPNVQLYAMPQALFIDKNMVEKYQFDYEAMKNINEIEPFLDKIKENEPDMYAYQPEFGVGPWVTDYETIVTGFNELVVKKDDDKCKVVKRYETQEYIDGVNKLRDWYQNGYIRKDISSADSSDAVSLERTVSYASSYKPGVEADVKKQRGKDFVAKTLSANYVTSDLCLQTLTGISKTSKHPDKAVKLLYLLHSDKELYNTLCHGIEGVHYKKIDDTFYAPIENSGYNPSRDWAFGNQFNSYLMEGKEKDVWEKSQDLNDSAKQSRLLGFNFNTEKVVNEISRCTAVLGEYKDLENGSVDVDTTLPRFSRKLQDAGIDVIIEELQKQIDEFIK